MLGRLSMSTPWLLDVNFETSAMSIPEDETIVADFSVLRSLVPNMSWKRAAGMCERTITPMYKSLHDMISDDIEHIAQVLYEVDPVQIPELAKPASPPLPRSPSPVNKGFGEGETGIPPCSSSSLETTRLRRKRRRPPDLQWHNSFKRPLTTPSTYPCIPTIIITPCDPHSRDTSCHVPYQNSAFHNRLTVPTYPAFNGLFPPMVLPPHPLPVFGHWEWQGGHWHSVLPGLREQAQKGLFSRALVVKKKACWTPGRRSAGLKPCLSIP